MYATVIFCVTVGLLTEFNLGLCKQQRYNPNTDFLLHEGGNYQNGQNKDTDPGQIISSANVNQNNGRRDYVSQFPQLGTPSTPKPSTQSSGKRDYVAQFPQLPTHTTSKPSTTAALNGPKPSSPSSNGGKRDYVAPQYSTIHTTSKPSTTFTLNTQKPSSPNGNGGKRDYVAPQYPTTKPTQGTSQPHGGKVKDLINFYDNQNTGQNTPQKVPSYSSILQGSTNKVTPGSTSTTAWTQPTARPSTPAKPLSFSNVVSGSKSPSLPTSLTPNSKPTTRVPVTPTARPGSPVLPSSIINNNKNNQVIGNGPATDAELQTLSEELLRKDVNNAAKFITVNYQEKTTSQSKEDKAPRPLFTIGPEVWNIQTIQTFLPLLDNYERDTLVNEHVTPQERNEENAFMDAIMSTSVIRHLMNFLKIKGFVSPDPRQQRDFLKQLWFGLYSRGKGKISSSGFEHIFVSELKNGEVSGLHNWIYFSKEEAANRINYLGYLKYVLLGEKGAVLKLHFNQQGVDKPVDSMFVGTSPELEISLYTLCFLTRVDTECKLKLADKDIEIVTHKFRYRSKDLIGSAYPQIPFNSN